MKHFYCRVALSAFFALFLYSCQNDEATETPTPDQQSKVLFSVDFGNAYTGDIKGYLAAYTPEGELLNYGSLGDSLKWNLKGKYNGDKIDILYFQIVNGITIQHIKSVPVGKTFSNKQNFELYKETYRKTFKIKVEDFGKRDDNAPMENGFMSTAYFGYSGNVTFTSLKWNKVENGYTYADVTLTKGNDAQEKKYGYQLLIFDKSTNKPYVKYLDLDTLIQNYPGDNDVITLNKSDFVPTEIKAVEVNANNLPYENMFLYTYNKQADRRDIVRSFNHISEGKNIWYLSNNQEVPMSFWRLAYSAKAGSTSYVAESNKKEIPSSVIIKELQGQSVSKTGDQYTFKHASVFPDKTLSRTCVSFYKNKYAANSFTYILNFNGKESAGSSTIKPFKIPTALLEKHSKYKEVDKAEWTIGDYAQVYDNRPSENPTLDLLSDLLLWKTNGYSENEYLTESYQIKL